MRRRGRQVAWAVVLAMSWILPVWAEGKTKLMLIDSFHHEFLSVRFTHKGFAEGLLKYGYLDNQAQVDELWKNDQVESSKAIIKVFWMDTRRKSSKPEQQAAAMSLSPQVKSWQPDLLFLAEDNAAEYLGNEFLDTKMPIVLWGINNTLVKYGLVDSEERPGHNVTGVLEPEHFVESFQLLKTIVPGTKTFAILVDDQETGRTNAKAIEFFASEGKLPLQLVETVYTNEFEVFKRKALELQEKVDAFVVIPTTSKDAQGNPVSDEDLMRWYLTNIHKPDIAKNRRGVTQGLLCAAETSSYSQGLEAVRIAHDILANGANPSTYPAVRPKRGALLVNRERAKMLGIALTPEMGIEEYIEEAAALKPAPPAAP